VTLELLGCQRSEVSDQKSDDEQKSGSALTSDSRPLTSDFTSLLFTLARVPGVFDDPYRPFRFRVPKSPACLICSAVPAPAAGEDLDVALDQALSRLGEE
jgi:hypothetical protein